MTSTHLPQIANLARLGIIKIPNSFLSSTSEILTRDSNANCPEKLALETLP